MTATPALPDWERRCRLAHQTRRAKERQLDDIRHALIDIGVIEDGDPYSHADLADVIRQLDEPFSRAKTGHALTCHAQECPCPPGCDCCTATAAPKQQDARQKPLTPKDVAQLIFDGHYTESSLGGDLAPIVLPILQEMRAGATSPPVSDDHPCAHPTCGHARRAHITGPVWCRHCPAQTSGPDQPGWHQYTPTKEQP